MNKEVDFNEIKVKVHKQGCLYQYRPCSISEETIYDLDNIRNEIYIQVAKTIDNGIVNDKGIPVTEEKEYRPLEIIKDNYPKYVLTLDYLLQQRNGIKHENIIKFIFNCNIF